MSVNKIILLGNLGKDPIIKKFDNGRSVATFSLATSEKYKDKTGNQVTKTEWHNVVAWSPLAEIAEKYLKKGQQVYLEGKVETREYTDKDGIARRTTEVVAREMNLVGSAQGSGGGYESAPAPAEQYAGKSAKTSDVPVDLAPSGDDDLPF